MTETENVEFRESWKSDHLKWICGFDNADGGKLFIGRDDNGYAVGLPGYRKLMEDILRNTGRLIRNPHSSKRKWTVVER